MKLFSDFSDCKEGKFKVVGLCNSYNFEWDSERGFWFWWKGNDSRGKSLVRDNLVYGVSRVYLEVVEDDLVCIVDNKNVDWTFKFDIVEV